MFFFTLTFLCGCGRNSEDSKKSKAPSAEQDKKIADLEAKLADKEEKLAEQERKTQKALQLGQDRVATLEDQVGDLEKKRDALTKRINQLEGSSSAQEIALLKNEKAKLDEQLTNSKEELASARRDLAAAKSSLDHVRTEKEELARLVKELKTKVDTTEAQAQMIRELTTPFQGLHSTVISQRTESGACEMAISVNEIAYNLVVACAGESNRINHHFERGMISKVAGGLRESSDQLDIDRKISLTPVISSCTNGVFATASSLEWSKAANEVLRANLSNNETIDGLIAGDSGRDTATCGQILARPDRSGLKSLVAACELIRKADTDLATADNVGCFKTNGDNLIFNAHAIRAINQ